MVAPGQPFHCDKPKVRRPTAVEAALWSEHRRQVIEALLNLAAGNVSRALKVCPTETLPQLGLPYSLMPTGTFMVGGYSEYVAWQETRTEYAIIRPNNRQISSNRNRISFVAEMNTGNLSVYGPYGCDTRVWH